MREDEEVGRRRKIKRRENPSEALNCVNTDLQRRTDKLMLRNTGSKHTARIQRFHFSVTFVLNFFQMSLEKETCTVDQPVCLTTVNVTENPTTRFWFWFWFFILLSLLLAFASHMITACESYLVSHRDYFLCCLLLRGTKGFILCVCVCVTISAGMLPSKERQRL